MADIEITVDGGTSKRLLTAGKYCDKNIMVTATGGGGSGTSVPAKDVNFYDYDGTLLYSYTIAEANILTELPQAPNHDGLNFQGWNYSLEFVQTTTKKINVGAVYITSDGKTRLYISVPENSEPGLPPPRSQIPLHFQQTVSNGVTIDWGDNSPTETISGTGHVSTTHIYQTAGDYVISLNPADECELNLGSGFAQYCVLGEPTNNNYVYLSMLKRVEVGKCVPAIGNNAFYYCQMLTHITIPNSVKSIGTSSFAYCYSLTHITIPNSVTSIGTSFQYCHSLKSITIPNSVTSLARCCRGCYTLSTVIIDGNLTEIADGSFRNCEMLKSITLPNSLTKIDSYAIAYCYSLTSVTIPHNVTEIASLAFLSSKNVKEYHIKPEVPPTLLDKNAFLSIASDCIIYVPVGSLELYKTAENWVNYADKMQEEA